jgi:hypothetical protein
MGVFSSVPTRIINTSLGIVLRKGRGIYRLECIQRHAEYLQALDFCIVLVEGRSLGSGRIGFLLTQESPHRVRNANTTWRHKSYHFLGVKFTSCSSLAPSASTMVEFRMDCWQDLSTDNSPLGSRWIIYLAAFNSCHDRIHVDQAFSRLDCAQVSLFLPTDRSCTRHCICHHW